MTPSGAGLVKRGGLDWDVQSNRVCKSGRYLWLSLCAAEMPSPCKVIQLLSPSEGERGITLAALNVQAPICQVRADNLTVAGLKNNKRRIEDAACAQKGLRAIIAAGGYRPVRLINQKARTGRSCREGFARPRSFASHPGGRPWLLCGRFHNYTHAWEAIALFGARPIPRLDNLRGRRPRIHGHSGARAREKHTFTFRARPVCHILGWQCRS